MIEPLLQAERLLIVGMLDQAEQLYRRVAEQDPRNSIARVGLARVALERGEDEVALAEARAALELDPENVAAVRMEARLSEVLAQRRASPGKAAPWDSTAPPPGMGPPARELRQAPAGHTPPDEEPAPAPDARPSERAVFARNPTMADHRRMQGVEPEAETQPEMEAQPGPAAGRETEPVPNSEPVQGSARRQSLLDRLLGRGRRA